eukprot:TRINITY_DN15064_c0_g1_i1.p1 TRINITY_DN15064_c0_g1~~TRINITY_DN15064_c0_g1_i1.p1  ORF type:complete len:185 (+),score=10.55 TRINITY_DN15064_c0_g1_i1:126-680(+)
MTVTQIVLVVYRKVYQLCLDAHPRGHCSVKDEQPQCFTSLHVAAPISAQMRPCDRTSQRERGASRSAFAATPCTCILWCVLHCVLQSKLRRTAVQPWSVAALKLVLYCVVYCVCTALCAPARAQAYCVAVIVRCLPGCSHGALPPSNSQTTLQGSVLHEESASGVRCDGRVRRPQSVWRTAYLP